MPSSRSVRLGLSAGLALALCGPRASAQEGGHPLFAPFPDSELVSVERLADARHLLVLGTLQRSSGIVAPEDSRRLRGDVTKLVYEVSRDFSGQDAYRFFEEQAAEKGYRELYRCAGRACGSSNYWANDVFGNRVLYGPERNQYYLALEAAGAEGAPAYISLYVITRGNRRVYAYLEILEESASTLVPAPSFLLAEITERGSVVLPDIVFSEQDQPVEAPNLEAAARLIGERPDLAFYLVAHLGGGQDLETLLRRSAARAEALRRRLVLAGADGARIIARGVGPLAPACAAGNCAERVELVLRRDSAQQ